MWDPDELPDEEPADIQQQLDDKCQPLVGIENGSYEITCSTYVMSPRLQRLLHEGTIPPKFYFVKGSTLTEAVVACPDRVHKFISKNFQLFILGQHETEAMEDQAKLHVCLNQLRLESDIPTYPPLRTYHMLRNKKLRDEPPCCFSFLTNAQDQQGYFYLLAENVYQYIKLAMKDGWST